ncbi:hypothetical protein CcaverHIS002_0605850 [Cutaneotrichosporon cavernicola]|uniref:Transcription elongation factor Eaf N-terminal domain-containing protein n=1 Tax=Cutaneotrichosporon cavernicola TaxID=279322 RepID=A0AA48L8W4_9TREE|nr:uncharacterized protein CcaverHIS019_0605310 [Cutaneotrichosporon cavernicola]BEI86298.1 hypothetical protein CcaverHIS002_0605850 [Cutaneotrichosporon cavernicola]BEI94072.1 hypothetical protein CcaverHIS019_0605310 [Cutaneotrichosporon cavernicola]BEJ01851.1 hypothetical protein CcaverHIS631_0605330 [Cutaneotrichosporon cavernicola]BEJ09616.1 hypothetical protein CcaverHIS641_0605310 [Cutaneotrichosporon cavernicola]
MSTADPLIVLSEGTFDLEFADSARDVLRGEKRPHDDVVALKYAFKPASVTSETAGVLEPAPSGATGAHVLSFDQANGSSQVFDVREEAGKVRECVLVWDEDRQTFTLHALPSTLHLTLNRTLSGLRKDGAFPVAEAPPPKKKRATTAGKGIARKQLPSAADLDPVLPSIEAPKKAVAKKKAAAKKAPVKKAAAKKKAAPASSPSVGKIKSVEIIEDSDDDLDEFADMLGDAMHEAMSDEEFEVEEDDDDELGGAQYAGYGGAEAEGDEEWI